MMTDVIRTLLAYHLPSYEVRIVAALEEGLDHAAYEVNGELIVRTSKEPDTVRRAASTSQEADLLYAVAEVSTLPVPEPVFVDPRAGVIAYRKLPGLPLMHHPVAQPSLLAPELGTFLGRLHGTPVEKVEGMLERDIYPLSAWLRDAEEDYRNVSGQLPSEACRQVEGFLGHSPPAEPRTLAFCHNDLGAEHILVDVEANMVSGVIDWTDSAITDPARDLALIYRDMGSEVCRLVLAHYEGSFDEDDRERTVFYARCKLIEDLAYGFCNPGAQGYAQTSLSHLERTFP